MFTDPFLALIASYTVIVIGITETINRLAKLHNKAALFISVILSFAVCLNSLSEGLIFYLLLSACVWLSANGLFKAFHNKIGL